MMMEYSLDGQYSTKSVTFDNLLSNHSSNLNYFVLHNLVKMCADIDYEVL